MAYSRAHLLVAGVSTCTDLSLAVIVTIAALQNVKTNTLRARVGGGNGRPLGLMREGGLERQTRGDGGAPYP